MAWWDKGYTTPKYFSQTIALSVNKDSKECNVLSLAKMFAVKQSSEPSNSETNKYVNKGIENVPVTRPTAVRGSRR